MQLSNKYENMKDGWGLVWMWQPEDCVPGSKPSALPFMAGQDKMQKYASFGMNMNII